MICMWCGESIEAAPDGASFLFLAKRGDKFGVADEWTARSDHAEGHQFFCHVACFRASIPCGQQEALAVCLDED